MIVRFSNRLRGTTAGSLDLPAVAFLTMSFQKELEHLINRYSRENGSDTPDFILAQYLDDCLTAWNVANSAREKWYGREKKISPITIRERLSEIAQLRNEVERLQSENKQHVSDKAAMNSIIQREIRTVEQQEVELLREQLKVSQQAVLDASREYSSLSQEVERLTRELAEAKWEIKSACQALQDEQNLSQKFAELLDQGPHDVLCKEMTLDGACDCWKKQADAAISGEKP